MYNFLKQLITEAGDIALAHKARLADVQVTRKSEKDLVTEADVAVENFLIEHIQQQYPDHAIVGEESGSHAGADYRWIIDPIDGTTSFVHDLPFFSISIALEKSGEPFLGAVYAPVLGELFMAEKGKGATLNGNPIRVSDRSVLSDCVMTTGLACLRQNLERNNLPLMAALAPKLRGLRILGSAAMDLCYVACGRTDASWELNLNIHDIAAGMLIATEAGGTVTDFSGQPEGLPKQILATNGIVFSEMSNILSTIHNQPPENSP